MSKYLALLFAAAMPLFASCTSLAKVVVADRPVSGNCAYNLEAEVGNLALPVLEEHNSQGMIVGLHLPNGRERFFGYGQISEENLARPGPDTVAAVGSLTKGLVGDLANQLVEDGILNWDDRLGSLLPTGVPLSKDASDITVWELATHTSGLPRQPRKFETLRLFVQYLFTGKDFYRKLNARQAYEFLGNWKKPAKPEDRHRYSNVGYALLAHILETKAGKPLSTLLREKVTTPLGLRSTGFDPALLSDQRMSGHVGDQPKFMRRGRPVADWRMNGFMQGTGGIYSTARDMLTYAEHHISPDHEGRNPEYAVAWHTDPIGDPNVFYQFGVNSGHSTFVGIDTRRQIAVVVLQNSFNWTDSVGRTLMKDIAAVHDARQNRNGNTCKSPGKIARADNNSTRENF